MLSKRRNLPRLIGFDVGVDEVTHVRFIGFQVQAFPAGLADDLAHFQVMVELLLDAGDVGRRVSGGFQFVGDVGVGAHQRHGRLVERGALRLAFLQVAWNLRVAAEIVDVLQFTLRRFHRLAQQRERFQRLVQPLPPFRQAILQQHLGIGTPRAVIQFGGVDRDGVSPPS